MLPLISLVAVGALTAVAYARTRRRAVRRSGWSPGHLRVEGQTVLASDERVLATEEVVLDNRFGNQALVSEHEFNQSATVVVESDWTGHRDLMVDADLLAVLKAELHGRLARKLGVTAGSQLVRQIRLKLTAAPGKKVVYRVVWQQTAQRGLLRVGVGRRVHEVPYLIHYGLAHAVQSVDMEGEMS
ncbi:MAG: hypothetical protein H7838_11530 [Magnetococcus sp. DMHC-8]